MNLFSWLRRLRDGGASARTTLNLESPAEGGKVQRETTDPLSHVRWIPAAENRFGVDVLDCSALAQSMVSVTSNAEIATRFTQLRGSEGEPCRGKDPGNLVTTRCQLKFPFDAHRAGPIFRAEQMEDKWDVFLLDGDLFFSRSWTGDVVYKASIIFEQSQGIVTEIRGQREAGSSEDPAAVVDYLIKSHVYGLVAPHPLPITPQTNEKDLALWSFARYGRRGLFGTKHDVTHLVVRRNQDGQCSLASEV
jgi:hypothetical protein